jgi:hypothetical protein
MKRREEDLRNLLRIFAELQHLWWDKPGTTFRKRIYWWPLPRCEVRPELEQLRRVRRMIVPRRLAN